MKFQPDYTFTADGKDIHLLFNTWMFRQYSIRKGIELDQLEESIKTGRPFPVNAIPDVLLIAHETFCKYNSLPFEATELDACDWIDKTGGMGSALYVDTYKQFLIKFLNLSAAEFDVMLQKAKEQSEAKPDKKKEPIESPGTTSTMPLQKRA